MSNKWSNKKQESLKVLKISESVFKALRRARAEKFPYALFFHIEPDGDWLPKSPFQDTGVGLASIPCQRPVTVI